VLYGLKINVPRYENVIGLPPKSIAITNSERSSMGCKSKWLFKYGDYIKSSAFIKPLEYGTVWHLCMEDLHNWWLERDSEYPGDGSSCVWCEDGCEKCGGTGHGPAHEILKIPEGAARREAADDEEKEVRQQMYATLVRVFTGYLRYWGRACPSGLQVIGTELELAAPIKTPNGGRFAPVTYLKESSGGYELAGTGDLHSGENTMTVKWPWYQCVKLDGLFFCRKTKGIWVYDAKSAASTERRIHNISVDPQVHGYCWAVRSCVRRGLLNHLHPEINKKTKVLGYIYDVASSSPQNPPELLAEKPVKKLGEDGQFLMNGKRFVYVTDEFGEKVMKSPGLSKRSSCASWVYRESIRENGFNPEDYSELLLKLETTVDPKLYKRYNGTQGEEGADRYQAEIYGICRDLAEMKRNAAKVKVQSDRFTWFPRHPVCMMTGCAFRGPCMQDGDLVRMNYEPTERLSWSMFGDDFENKEVLKW
jgi:hypothetical protein